MKNRSEPVMLIASRLDNVARFGTIKIECDHVISFQQATGKEESGVVNGGLYLIDSSLFSKKKEPFSLEYDLFPKLVKNRQLIAYITKESESFIDIGTPDSYKKICGK